MKARILIALSALALAGTVFAEGKVSDADARAMKKLAAANLAEINAGKLAADKAKSAEVKKFGQQMVEDHGKMLDELKKLASAKGVSLPGTPDMEERAKTLKLRAEGESFDKDYMSEMVKDHQKDVQQTADLAKSIKDPQLKSAVEKAHSKIRQHLATAQKIAGSQGAAAGATQSKSSK
jgi:putative membrane protein